MLAVLILSGRDLRPVLAWAALWGVITAASRVVQGGGGALHQTLIRAANGGLPFVLLLLTERPSMKTQSPGAVGRFARVALPVLALVLPFTAGAQALSGPGPAQLRLVWTEDPAHRTTFSWSTSGAGATHEVYLDTQPRKGELGVYGRKVTATSNGSYGGGNGGPYYHHADVTGLEPATTYYFVVVSDGVASPERHFITGPTDDRAFRLLSGGDSRSGVGDRQKMNQAIAKLVEQDPGIIALAHGGDYIESANNWSEWNSWLADHALTFTADGRVLPIIPVRGNHEGDGSMYNEVFGFPGGREVDYWVTQLGAHANMIVLDTNVSIGGDQAKWLEQKLQEAQAGRWIIPNYHRPAFPAVKTPGGARQFWVPLFEKYDVDVACESDGHVLKRTVPIRNEKLDPTGVVYVGEGGLGVSQRAPVSQWYLNAPGMAKSAHHVQVFSFSPDKLVYQAKGMNGTVEDTHAFLPRRSPAAPAPAPESPAVASAVVQSSTRIEVTYSTDMDPATTAVATAYTISPEVAVRDVMAETPRTVVLTTDPLTAETEYTLTIAGATSAIGVAMSQPWTATFTGPAPGEAPEVAQPTAPPEPQPATGVEGAEKKSGGCAAAGGSLAWAGLGAIAFAARNRRRTRPGARPCYSTRRNGPARDHSRPALVTRTEARDYAFAFFVRRSSSLPASTTMVSPGANSPLSTFIASGSCR